MKEKVTMVVIARKAEAEDGAGEAEVTERTVISGSKLKSLMKSKRSAQKDITAIAGGLGSAIKSAVEDEGLDRQIFNFCCMLDKKENEDIADKLTTLKHYLEVGGLNARAAKATGRLELGAGQEDAAGEETAPKAARKPREGKVRPFPKPRGESQE